MEISFLFKNIPFQHVCTNSDIFLRLATFLGFQPRMTLEKHTILLPETVRFASRHRHG